MLTLMKRSVDRAERVRGRLVGLYALLIVANVGVWGWALFSFRHAPVLLGTAMVAAVAGGLYPDLFVAVDMMAPSQLRYQADGAWRRAHEIAYGIYLRLFHARNDVAQESRMLAGMSLG